MTGGALFFAEDPGAANFVAALPELLRARGVPSVVLGAGPAVSFLRERGLQVDEPGHRANPTELLQRVEARVVAVGTSQNPDSFSLALVDAAKGLGIPTVGLVDMAVDAELRFAGRTASPLAHATDWLLVPDQASHANFQHLGFPPDRILISGHPGYDRARSVAQRLQEGDRRALRERILLQASHRPLVVFVAEHVDGCDSARMSRGPQYTLHGRGGRDERTMIVLEELIDALAAQDRRASLALRLHPRNALSEFSDYLPEVDHLSCGGDPLELMWAADLVVGMTSMLLVEAAVMGKPTLAVLPRAEECAWTPNTALGWTRSVCSRDDLRSTIREFLFDPRFARTLMAPEELRRPDRAGPRVVDRLCQFMKSS